MNTNDTLLSIAVSDQDANQYYATKFLVPDPFIFLHHHGRSVIVLSDLEIERGKHDAEVDEVVSLSTYRERLQAQGQEFPQLLDLVDAVLQDYQIRTAVVPGNFPVQYADPLRARGYTLMYREPYFESRIRKTPTEVAHIQQAQRANEAALSHALQILRDAEIGGDQLLYYRGAILSSEYMQQQIQMKLLELNCLSSGTIVTCGEQATRPHEHGSGPLTAHQAIIIDIFPQSLTSRYFADMTRTVVKGRASEELHRLYATVKAGQELALQHIRPGVKGQEIHREIQALFEQAGYQTGVIDGTMQGFFHGTGHGVGLEIHEPPRIGNADATLEAGYVVTVEPGLYYTQIGGVRIEDLVVVTEEGCTNLTNYPKTLEL
jgi:Xaa-Pro aminopeptidase